MSFESLLKSATAAERLLAEKELLGRIASAEQHDDEREHAMLSALLGVLYLIDARPTKAIDLLLPAAAAAQRLGDLNTEASALSNLAVAQQRAGMLADAEETFLRARPLLLASGGAEQLGAGLNNQGVALEHAGRLTEALELYGQALEIRLEAGDLLGAGITLHNIGMLDLGVGRLEQALGRFLAAIPSCKRQMISRDLFSRSSMPAMRSEVCIALRRPRRPTTRRWRCSTTPTTRSVA